MDRQPPDDRRARAQRKAHIRARERGPSRALYAVVRILLTPFLRGWFRLRFKGVQHIPAEGPAILAPNHKSFLDPFFLGMATHRHVRYMAKIELFKGPLGPVLLRLGAFPVRRGEADADAVETARAILEQGGLVVVFPEGTRVDEPDVLGSPHHGAGRLALETGAPIVPVAIAGTANLWLGPFPKPRHVRIAFLPPVRAGDRTSTEEALADLVDRRVWPAVQDEYGRLAATPGVVVAALSAMGVGGGLVARRRLRARTRPRIVGIVEPRRVRRARRRLLRR